MKTLLANILLKCVFFFDWRQFWKRKQSCQEVQKAYLLSLIRNNADTKFGRLHNFGEIKNTHDFQNYIPVSNYEDYLSYIDLIRKGESLVLTTDPVLKFSVSSGTTSASKYIPNTSGLISEFNKCISVWMYDLYKNFPELLKGKSFWIITPSADNENDSEKIKNGFDDDSEYFSPIKRWLIKNVFVVPDEVPKFCRGENYYFALAIFLLAEKNLRLISVWNPSVLLILLEKTFFYRTNIICSLETGQILFPEDIDPHKGLLLNKKLKKDPQRATEISKYLNTLNWMAIWPNLKLISAWDSSWACNPALKVKQLFPNVVFQGKGLLATEACITFPAYNKHDNYEYYPALYSHFFEFQAVNGSGIKLLHELEPNQKYEVLVTTSGGFYRYRLYDIVTCIRYENDLPILEFEGKSNVVSDLTGEKLNEIHVSHVIKEALMKLNIDSELYYISPQKTDHDCIYKYCLYLHTTSSFEPSILKQELEMGLQQNFHYKHSRALNQLQPLDIVLLTSKDVRNYYDKELTKKKLGTTKLGILRNDFNE